MLQAANPALCSQIFKEIISKYSRKHGVAWITTPVSCSVNLTGQWNIEGAKYVKLDGQWCMGGARYVKQGRQWNMGGARYVNPKCCLFLSIMHSGVAHTGSASHIQNVRWMHSSTNNSGVTFETIFSAENKERFVRNIKSTEPVTLQHIKIRDNPSQAAILIPLCYADQKPSVLFTLRTSSLRKHRGEVSFPGGKRDEQDCDLEHTALRETWEELGIKLDMTDIWGSMIVAPGSRDGRSAVTPVIGFCGNIDFNSLKLSEDEVEEVFTRSIESLCDVRYIGTTQFRTVGGYSLPVFLGGPHRIWGLTSTLLHQMLTMLAPELYSYEVKHQY